MLGGLRPLVNPRDVTVREKEDRLRAGKDGETSQLPVRVVLTVVNFPTVVCEHSTS